VLRKLLYQSVIEKSVIEKSVIEKWVHYKESNTVITKYINEILLKVALNTINHPLHL
jgi:hypothetical protein